MLGTESSSQRIVRYPANQPCVARSEACLADALRECVATECHRHGIDYNTQRERGDGNGDAIIRSSEIALVRELEMFMVGVDCQNTARLPMVSRNETVSLWTGFVMVS